VRNCWRNQPISFSDLETGTDHGLQTHRDITPGDQDSKRTSTTVVVVGDSEVA